MSWLVNNFLASVFCMDVAFRNVRDIDIVMLERDAVGNAWVAVYKLISNFNSTSDMLVIAVIVAV